MSFQETASFKKIKEYVEHRIRHELEKRQTELLDKLNEIVVLGTAISGSGPGPRDAGSGPRGPVPESEFLIDLRSVAEPIHKSVDHKKQCLALVSGHRRCTKTSDHSDHSDLVDLCSKHRENGKRIDNFKERAEPLDADFDFVSLRSRKGRLHYVSPKERLSEYYVPVNLVYIERQAYLQDESGFLYQLDEQLSRVGQRKGGLSGPPSDPGLKGPGLVFWYM